MMRLIKVSYTNEMPVDSTGTSVELIAEDSLNNFERKENEIFATYERKFHSTDSKILISVVFQFRSAIKNESKVSDSELIDLIQKHKSQYVLLAPSEASLIITNIMKSAGFPPVITPPTFIEKTKN